jgi:hypothetical protein
MCDAAMLPALYLRLGGLWNGLQRSLTPRYARFCMRRYGNVAPEKSTRLNASCAFAAETMEQVGSGRIPRLVIREAARDLAAAVELPAPYLSVGSAIIGRVLG